MGIRLALQKLRDIVKATTPTTVHGAYPSRFTFEASSGDGRGATTRAFWFEIGDDVRAGPYTTGRRNFLRNADLVVFYASQEDVFEQSIVIAEDHVALSTALLDDSGWDELTTGLAHVAGGPGEQDTLLPSTREPLEGGGVLMRISMVLDVYED